MQKSMKIAGLYVLLVSMAFISPASAVDYPDTMTEIQPLSFGTFAMRDNSAAYSMTVSPTGMVSYSHANKILPFGISNPQPGIFQFTDFAPSTLLVINIADTVITGGGPDFDLVNFVFAPDPASTDAGGNLTLNIGATLRTSGLGGIYWDGGYSGNYVLSVSY
jgi:hypothetical protein